MKKQTEKILNWILWGLYTIAIIIGVRAIILNL